MIRCPQCRHDLDGEPPACPHCRTDLTLLVHALAAVRGERRRSWRMKRLAYGLIVLTVAFVALVFFSWD